MLILRYDPDGGEAVRDGRNDALARDFVRLAARGDNVSLVYSTENVFYAARILVAEGKIDPLNIRFKFGETIIQVDAKGNLSSWPTGFLDYTDSWLEKLIGLRYKK